MLFDVNHRVKTRISTHSYGKRSLKGIRFEYFIERKYAADNYPIKIPLIF